MTERMASVPVEPTKAMLAAAATSDWLYKDDVASTIWSAMLTAAPAREEGGAVIRKALQAELDWHDRVADFACDEARECSARGEKADEATAMRRMNAHNERASLIRTALATREEAPAEAGELAEAVERLTSAADFLEGDCVIVGDHEVRGNDLLTVLSALRAQPQAREEAPDWTARTEAAWAENNREEAPADHVSDARQMVEAPAEAGEVEAPDPWDVEHRLAEVEGFGASFCHERGGWRLYSMPDAKEFGFITGYDRPSIDFVCDALRAALRAQPRAREEAQPVAVTIFCPECSLPHVDEGEWATTRHHKTHQCQGCGHEWRPFPFATVGVSHPTTPPAPEAEKLRVALRKIAFGDGGIGTHRAIALAALQQEGRDHG